MTAPALSGHLVAVDIGAHGALALFDAIGTLLDVQDMPTLCDGPANRPTVNTVLLAGLVRRWAPRHAIVEHVSARPGEGAVGAFAFGRSRGVVEGTLASAGVIIQFTTPAAWKRKAGIAPGRENKDRARSLAIARWPDRADLFARAKDIDRAEACLIGAGHFGAKP